MSDMWQSGACKEHRQAIPAGKVWRRLHVDVGDRSVSGFDCLVDGPHDIDWAIRVLPGVGRLWVRVVRLPYDRADNGTRWVGPIRLDRVEHTYDGRCLMDKQGGIAGHGYGIEARADRGAMVDQVYLKLAPR